MSRFRSAVRRPVRFVRPAMRGVVPPARIALTAIVLLGAAAVGDATAQIEAGRIYNGGERISEPSNGLSLILPNGWRGALSPDGTVFMMESLEGGGVMIVRGDQMGEDLARSELAAPVQLGGGIVLNPSGEIEEIGPGHLTSRFTVTGTPTEMVSNVDVRLTDTGLGVAFVLLSPTAAESDQLGAMREFALSLGVEAVPVQQGGSDEWEPYLRGRYLAKYFTRSGYTESTELWLCPNGDFYFNSQVGGFGGGASGAFQDLASGRWRAEGSGNRGQLFLDWADGSTSQWLLEYDPANDRLFVDGARWLRGQNERCPA